MSPDFASKISFKNRRMSHLTYGKKCVMMNKMTNQKIKVPWQWHTRSGKQKCHGDDLQDQVISNRERVFGKDR